MAVGQSSGSMAVLDLRNGNIISSWKAHEGEVGDRSVLRVSKNCLKGSDFWGFL